MTEANSSLSRRKLLAGAGLGAAVVTAGVVGSTGTALADTGARTKRQGNNRQRSSTPQIRPHIALPAATNFTNVNYADFHAYDGVTTINDGGSGYYCTNGLITGVVLPDGALITEVDAWGGTGLDVTLYAATNGVYDWNGVAEVVVGAGSGTVQGSAAPSTFTVVDNINNSYLFYATTAASSPLVSVRVGYVPLSLGYVPIAPTRVYDSRLAGGGGAISGGTHRTVRVADAIDGTGAVVQTDVVPAEAVAISANLTVVGVSASGFLAVTPGGSTGFTASSINWSSKTALANAQDMTLGGDRQLTVFSSATGVAQFIIDVSGYYL